MFSKLKEMLFKIKDYDRMQDDYSKLLMSVSNNHFSKTNYDLKFLIGRIDSIQESFYWGIIKDDIESIIADNGSIEDISNYLDTID